MPDWMRERYDTMEVLDAVLSVVGSNPRPRDMVVDYVKRLREQNRDMDEYYADEAAGARGFHDAGEMDAYDNMREREAAGFHDVAAAGREADGARADLIADAQARLNDPNASEYEKQAARTVLRYRQRDGRDGVTAQGTEGDGMRYRIRTKEPPKKTRKVYKLMRLGEDGKLYPLFIDSASPIELGTWYDADSPNLDFLKTLTAGVHLVNAETGESMTLEQFSSEHPELKIRGSNPNAAAIDWATANGMRWMKVVSKDRGQRRYGGELRSYYNYGINGSGAVETYALRPGWHAGSLPTMRQIGKGPNKNLRDNRFVWVEGEVAADVDYQGEADANPDKDIPDRIPEDGYYLKATNADKAKSQADRVGWFVSGAFKANRIISDAEARRVIDQWNAEHPDQKVEYDYERESGVEFSEEDAARVNGGGEKATTIERGDAVSGNPSDGGLRQGGSEHLSHNPLTHQEDAAKIQRNTDITLRAARKIQNEGGLKKQISTATQAVSAIGKGLHLDKSDSSQSYYGDVYEGDIMVDGRLLHLRVSDHEANGARMGNANADHKVSLVIRKNGEHVSTGEHNGYTEWVFEPSEVSPKDAANAIIGGVESLIRTGEFVDATGKAHRHNYPYTDNNGVVHYRVRRAPNGESSR